MNFLLNLIPPSYKWSVGIKKVSWTIAKTGVAIVAGSKIGEKVPLEHWLIVTEVSAALIAGGMMWIHDWAKLKYPDQKWL